MTPEVALQLASPAYRELVATKSGATWPNLVDVSRHIASNLGIAQAAWGRACERLGRERAAICVLVIERNFQLRQGHPYRAQHPGKCLSGMLRTALGEGFNLHGLLRSIRPETTEPAGTDCRLESLAEARVSRPDDVHGIGDLVGSILKQTPGWIGHQR